MDDCLTIIYRIAGANPVMFFISRDWRRALLKTKAKSWCIYPELEAITSGNLAWLAELNARIQWREYRYSNVHRTRMRPARFIICTPINELLKMISDAGVLRWVCTHLWPTLGSWYVKDRVIIPPKLIRIIPYYILNKRWSCFDYLYQIGGPTVIAPETLARNNHGNWFTIFHLGHYIANHNDPSHALAVLNIIHNRRILRFAMDYVINAARIAGNYKMVDALMFRYVGSL